MKSSLFPLLRTRSEPATAVCMRIENLLSSCESHTLSQAAR